MQPAGVAKLYISRLFSVYFLPAKTNLQKIGKPLYTYRNF